jgi:hypothetical protein
MSEKLDLMDDDCDIEGFPKDFLHEDNDRDYWTRKAMRQFGGGFVQQLAHLAEQADSNNLARIKAAWPEYWKQYEEMGRSLKDKK